MTADHIQVVPLETVPTAEVLSLLETCLGPGSMERNEAFWRWKHEASPFGRSPGLVALAGGWPVALRVFLRWRWAAAGRIVEAVRAVDTATHPGWRRRGLFRRLTRELVDQVRDEGAVFVFNTPNRRSRRGYRSLGWQDVGRLPLLVRLRRPGTVLRALLRRGGGRGGDGRATGIPAGTRPLGELLAEPALPNLLTAWGGREERLHTLRTLDYLRWRYASAAGRYGALWHLDGTSGAVVVVRSRRRRTLREVTLSEVLVSDDPLGRSAVRDLLASAEALPEADYLAAVAVPGSPERRVLRQAGWMPAPGAPRLTVQRLQEIGPDPREPGDWRLSVGDLELF